MFLYVHLLPLFLLLLNVFCQQQYSQHGNVEVQGQAYKGHATGDESLHEEIPIIYELQQVPSNIEKQNSINGKESREEEIAVERRGYEEIRHQGGHSQPHGSQPNQQRVLHKDIEHEKEYREQFSFTS